MDLTLVFALGTTLVFLLLALNGKALYVNLGKLGGYRVRPGRLEQTKMRDTKGLSFLNIGNISRRQRKSPAKRARMTRRGHR